MYIHIQQLPADQQQARATEYQRSILELSAHQRELLQQQHQTIQQQHTWMQHLIVQQQAQQAQAQPQQPATQPQPKTDARNTAAPGTPNTTTATTPTTAPTTTTNNNNNSNKPTVPANNTTITTPNNNNNNNNTTSTPSVSIPSTSTPAANPMHQSSTAMNARANINEQQPQPAYMPSPMRTRSIDDSVDDDDIASISSLEEVDDDDDDLIIGPSSGGILATAVLAAGNQNVYAGKNDSLQRIAAQNSMLQRSNPQMQQSNPQMQQNNPQQLRSPGMNNTQNQSSPRGVVAPRLFAEGLNNNHNMQNVNNNNTNNNNPAATGGVKQPIISPMQQQPRPSAGIINTGVNAGASNTSANMPSTEAQSSAISTRTTSVLDSRSGVPLTTTASVNTAPTERTPMTNTTLASSQSQNVSSISLESSTKMHVPAVGNAATVPQQQTPLRVEANTGTSRPSLVSEQSKDVPITERFATSSVRTVQTAATTTTTRLQQQAQPSMEAASRSAAAPDASTSDIDAIIASALSLLRTQSDPASILHQEESESRQYFTEASAALQEQQEEVQSLQRMYNRNKKLYDRLSDNEPGLDIDQVLETALQEASAVQKYPATTSSTSTALPSTAATTKTSTLTPASSTTTTTTTTTMSTSTTGQSTSTVARSAGQPIASSADNNNNDSRANAESAPVRVTTTALMTPRVLVPREASDPSELRPNQSPEIANAIVNIPSGSRAAIFGAKMSNSPAKSTVTVGGATSSSSHITTTSAAIAPVPAAATTATPQVSNPRPSASNQKWVDTLQIPLTPGASSPAPAKEPGSASAGASPRGRHGDYGGPALPQMGLSQPSAAPSAYGKTSVLQQQTNPQTPYRPATATAATPTQPNNPQLLQTPKTNVVTQQQQQQQQQQVPRTPTATGAAPVVALTPSSALDEKQQLLAWLQLQQQQQLRQLQQVTRVQATPDRLNMAPNTPNGGNIAANSSNTPSLVRQYAATGIDATGTPGRQRLTPAAAQLLTTLQRDQIEADFDEDEEMRQYMGPAARDNSMRMLQPNLYSTHQPTYVQSGHMQGMHAGVGILATQQRPNVMHQQPQQAVYGTPQRPVMQQQLQQQQTPVNARTASGVSLYASGDAQQGLVNGMTMAEVRAYMCVCVCVCMCEVCLCVCMPVVTRNRAW